MHLAAVKCQKLKICSLVKGQKGLLVTVGHLEVVVTEVLRIKPLKYTQYLISSDPYNGLAAAGLINVLAALLACL